MLRTALRSSSFCCCAVIAVVAIAVAPAFCATEPAPFLPRGYSYPAPPETDVPTGDPLARERLRFDDKYGVYYHIDLDPTDAEWSHKLLRIEAGKPEPWSPEIIYALFPKGFKGYEHVASVILARKLVLFEKKYDLNGAVVVRSTNHPDYSLQRAGDFMVVTKAGDRRWIFESVDGGETWRMAALDFPQYPGKRVTLSYENEKIVKIEFPGGREASLSYNVHGFPTKITTPFGERVTIERGADQMVRKVEVFSTDDKRDPPKPIRTYHFVYGGSGHIEKFTDYDGQSFRIEYRYTEKDEDKTYLTLIHDLQKKGYRFERMTFKPDGSQEMELGFGKNGERTENAAVTTRKTLKKVATRLLPTEVMHRGGERKVAYDKHGLPVEQIDATGTKIVTEFDQLGNATKVSGSNGVQVVRNFNDLGLLTDQFDSEGQEVKGYDARGRQIRALTKGGLVVTYEYPEDDTILSVVDGAKHVFRSDALGRIVEHREPDGQVTKWEYNARGQMILRTRIPANESGRPEETKYLYTVEGYLEWVAHPGGGEDQYVHDSGLLKSIYHHNGDRTIFGYDEARRLNRRESGDNVDLWIYDEQDRMITHGIRRGEKDTTMRYGYHPTGQLAWEQKNNDARKYYFYNAAGKIDWVLWPNGTATIFKYEDGKLVGLERVKTPPAAVESQKTGGGE